jgi:uncharacterized protein YwqG
MTRDLDAVFDLHGLARAKDLALALALPSIRIRARRRNEMDMAVGLSKIGGQPDLPPGVKWPLYRERPLSFLAQINLSDVQPFRAARQLPARGLLSFFYDAIEQPWGFDPADVGRWSVLYFPDDPEGFVRIEWPDDLDDEGRFDACAISFEEDALTLPPLQHPGMDRLELTDDERLAYLAAFGSLEETTLHRMLGHPDTIQNEMQTECALVTNGVYLGDVISHDDPNIQLLAQGYRDWLLLLQLDSEDDARMMWGDVGRLYFWMRADALAERRFEDVWVILQCT